MRNDSESEFDPPLTFISLFCRPCVGTDYGHSEVLAFTAKDPREYCISTKSFALDDEGNLKGLNTVRVEWTEKGGKWSMEEVDGSEQVCALQSVIHITN